MEVLGTEVLGARELNRQDVVGLRQRNGPHHHRVGFWSTRRIAGGDHLPRRNEPGLDVVHIVEEVPLGLDHGVQAAAGRVQPPGHPVAAVLRLVLPVQVLERGGPPGLDHHQDDRDPVVGELLHRFVQGRQIVLGPVVRDDAVIVGQV